MIDQETLKTFDNLYDETYNYVLKYVICNCSNIDDVSDIIQNVYLEVVKKIKKDEKILISKSYILGITKNKVKDYYRFKYKNKITSLFTIKKDIDFLEQIPSEIDLQADFIFKEDTECVWNYLKKKNVIVSKIFYLFYYENLNIKQIAKELKISESNVKNYLYRTLKELKTLLKVGSDNNA